MLVARNCETAVELDVVDLDVAGDIKCLTAPGLTACKDNGRQLVSVRIRLPSRAEQAGDARDVAAEKLSVIEANVVRGGLHSLPASRRPVV